jgi:hypothetical protein
MHRVTAAALATGNSGRGDACGGGCRAGRPPTARTASGAARLYLQRRERCGPGRPQYTPGRGPAGSVPHAEVVTAQPVHEPALSLATTVLLRVMARQSKETGCLNSSF